MNRSLFRLVNEELERGGSGVLCTVVGSGGSTPRDLGSSMWVRTDGSISGSVGGGPLEYDVIRKALELLRSGSKPTLHETVLGEMESGAVCGGDVIILMEPLGRDVEVVVFGAGHIGKALAQAASVAGYRVIVWDERKEFADPELIPWGKVIACTLDEAMQGGVVLHESSYVVVATRGHALDAEVVGMLEGKTMAYLGLVGSRKKIGWVRERLLKQGVSQEHLDMIFQPVGLPIGAETPEEIAVSVLSEIIAVSRGADLVKLRSGLSNAPGPFYPVPQNKSGGKGE